jgi:hypothetical protein
MVTSAMLVRKPIVWMVAALMLGSCSAAENPSPNRSPEQSRGSPSPRASAGGGVERAHIRIFLCRRCVESSRAEGVDLRPVVRATILQVQKLFPDLAAMVRVRVNPAASIPEVGVGGFTDLTTGVVTMSLDPSFSGFGTTLRVWLPLTLAHELDHAQRTLHGPGYGDTLLQAMVSEGMADAFARQVFPHAPPIPWDHVLNRVEVYLLWRLARTRLGERQDSAAHAMWFYGTGRVPRWAGYTIGRDIVESYLGRRPGVTAAQIVRLPARRILRGSRFR